MSLCRTDQISSVLVQFLKEWVLASDGVIRAPGDPESTYQFHDVVVPGQHLRQVHGSQGTDVILRDVQIHDPTVHLQGSTQHQQITQKNPHKSGKHATSTAHKKHKIRETTNNIIAQ